MQEILLALVVLSLFVVMWITAAVAGAVVIRQRLAQRNRVVPTEPTAAPLLWLWSPLPAARLHRRLQTIGGAAASVSEHGPAQAHDPDPVTLEDIAAQLAYQAIVLDAALVHAGRLPGAERRTEMRRLSRQVRDAEKVSGRLVEHRRPVGMPASGWAAAAPSTDAALGSLNDRLDRLDHARSELDDIERSTLHPEEVIPVAHPKLSHLPPPPAVDAGSAFDLTFVTHDGETLVERRSR